MTDEFIKKDNLIESFIMIGIIILGLSQGLMWNKLFDIDEGVSKIVEEVDNARNSQEQIQQTQSDEFSELSDDALFYYNKLDDKVSGTPTWLIDDVKYVGFDYKNNKIPGFKGDLTKAEIILFSSPTCSFCEKAEQYLEKFGYMYFKVCAPIHLNDYAKYGSGFIK